MDPRRLETLYQFANFIEAISDPKQLKITLDEIKGEADRLKELSGIYLTVASVEKLKKDTENDLNKEYFDLQKEKDKFKASREAKELELKKREEVISISEAKVAKMQSEAAEASRQESVALEAAKELKQTLEKRMAQLDEMERSLREAESLMQAKAERLKALMG